MFWIFLIAMAFVWFMIPKDDNTWTVLDEKPKRYKWYSKSSMSKKKYDYKKKYYYKKKYGYKKQVDNRNSKNYDYNNKGDN